MRSFFQKKRGWMMLESAIILSIFFPILLGVFGLVDYMYVQMAAKRLLTNALPEVNIPTIDINTGDQGFFTRPRTDELNLAMQNVASQLHARITSSLGLQPPIDTPNYRLEVGFAYFHIEEQDGHVIDFGNWGTGTSPNGSPNYDAVNAHCFGGLKLPGGFPANANICDEFIASGTPPDYSPQPSIAPIYDIFLAFKNQGTPVANPDSPIATAGFPNPLNGTYRQNYYGPNHEYGPGPSANLNTPNHTTVTRYVRHSVLLGAFFAVDIKYRMSGPILNALKIPTVIKMQQVVAPRVFF